MAKEVPHYKYDEFSLLHVCLAGKGYLVEGTFDHEVGNVHHDLGELAIVVGLVVVQVVMLENSLCLKKLEFSYLKQNLLFS